MAVYAHKGERKEPSWSTPPTNYSYAKPTEKSQPGLPEQLGYNIEEYKLPVVDVQTSKRNFPGYTESQVYTMEELRLGDRSGTTETDSVTDPKGSGGYSTINQKSGSKGRPWKRS